MVKHHVDESGEKKYMSVKKKKLNGIGPVDNRPFNFLLICDYLQERLSGIWNLKKLEKITKFIFFIYFGSDINQDPMGAAAANDPKNEIC